MVRWLVSGESEVLVFWSECALAFAWRGRETMKTLRQGIRCPTRDSNGAPPEYETRSLPLQKPTWHLAAIWYILPTFRRKLLPPSSGQMKAVRSSASRLYGVISQTTI
jgi:hypothetical protein